MKQTILNTLSKDSWNGTAVNGTVFTQWKATEEFFTLWREKKDEIKACSFSLYKHDSLGWVVTLFNEQIGAYESYDKYNEAKNKERFEKVYRNIIGWIEDSRLGEWVRSELIDEVENMTTLQELAEFINREAENPDRVWKDVNQ